VRAELTNNRTAGKTLTPWLCSPCC